MQSIQKIQDIIDKINSCASELELIKSGLVELNKDLESKLEHDGLFFDLLSSSKFSQEDKAAINNRYFAEIDFIRSKYAERIAKLSKLPSLPEEVRDSVFFISSKKTS
jgi:hypothetical protein